MNTIRFVGLIAIVVLNTACGMQMSQYYECPAGYVCKVLTPTGFQDNLYKAGQVNLGGTDANNQQNILVRIEATTISIKEQFLPPEATPDKQDHRLTTKNGTPLTTDIYVQVALTNNDGEVDNKLVDSILAQVTPHGVENQPRIKEITLREVYDRFASMNIRGRMRTIFTKYEDDSAVYENYAKINDEIKGAVQEAFKQTLTPVRMVASQISNVKPDAKVYEARIEQSAAAARAAGINTVAAAMRNPGAAEYMKWDTISKVGGRHIIVVDSTSGGGRTAQSFAAAAYAREGSDQISTQLSALDKRFALPVPAK
jgi:hypothetical protein